MEIFSLLHLEPLPACYMNPNGFMTSNQFAKWENNLTAQRVLRTYAIYEFMASYRPKLELSVYTDISLDTFKDCFSVEPLCRPKNQEGFQC
jgi:hypothetical protein